MERKKSMGTKLSVIIIIIVLVSSLSVAIIGYLNMKNTGTELAGKKALAIAKVVAKNIDSEQFLELVETSDENHPYYDITRKWMLDMEKESDAAYIYTVVLDKEGYYRYIIDGGEVDEEDFSPLGYIESVEDFQGTEPVEVTETGKTIISEPYGDPKSEYMIAGFAPIVDAKGNVVGVVGCDMDMNDLMLDVNRNIPKMLGMTLIVSILLFFITYIFFKKYIVEPLKKVSEQALSLSQGDLDIKVDEFLINKILSRNDEISTLLESVKLMIEHMIEQAHAAREIALGKNNVKINVRSDKDILALGLKGILENNDKLSTEIANLSKAAGAGDLTVRANEEAFEGRWKELVHGLNDLVEKVAGPLTDAGEYIRKIANGEYVQALDTSAYEGEFKVLVQNLLEVRSSMYAMAGAMNKAEKEAVEGNLSYRADLSLLKGGYADIVKAMNNTLDAVIEPIKDAEEVLGEMAKGNLGVRVTGDYKGDHAQIKNALNFMGENIHNYIVEISEVLGQMSNQNFDVSIHREYLGDFIELKNSINHIIDQFNSLLGEINSAAEQVEVGVNQVASSSQTLAAGASEQASSLEEISATIMQVAEQTRENDKNASKAYEFAQGGCDGAKEGNKRMDGMVIAMNQIKESSKNINGVIKVIDDIAFQTNILALNAAVEAARAGEHGKGFAVVAEEVRNLAARSAKAAKETTDLIENSIKKVEEGYEMANETAKALNQIEQSSILLVNINDEIAEASKQQLNAIEEINKGIEQISLVTQTNTATTEESASVSEEMAGQAQVLKNLIEAFKLKQASNGVKMNFLEKNSIEDEIQDTLEDEQYDTMDLKELKISLDDDDFGKY